MKFNTLKEISIKVAVLGASGRVGSAITKELVARGHHVIAIARTIEAISAPAFVTKKSGDASDPTALAKLIHGSDLVISALRFDVKPATLLAALKTSGVNRLLVTGGAASLEVAPGSRLIDTQEFPLALKPVAEAGITFLEAIRKESDVDWTVFSPSAVMEEGPRLGCYRLGGDWLVIDDQGQSRISFADYAIAMVDELEQHRHTRSRFTAGY